MTDFNRLMYGFTFGVFTSMLGAAIYILIIYGNHMPNDIESVVIPRILVIQTIIGAVGFRLTRYKSTDSK